MKKILSIFFLFSYLSFSYEISDLDFSKEILKGNTEFKEYTLKNNDEYIVRYDFYIEDDKDVLVSPTNLILMPGEEKKFKIFVKADKEKGKHSYFFVIKEKIVNKEKKKNELVVNLTSRIFQEYLIK